MVFPTFRMPEGRVSQIVSPLRLRRWQKSFYNFQLTVICLFVTFLVLRSFLGAGKYGTPKQDLEEIRNHLIPHRDGSTRTMMQLTATKLEASSAVEGDVNPRSLLEEEFDSVEYFDPAKVHHTLGERITDWDERRAAVLNSADNTEGSNQPHGKRRILMVSGSQPKPCDNPKGDYFILKNLKNKVDYCRLHNIDIFYNTAQLDMKMSGFWSKLPLLRALMLSHPEVEWFWWMDSDAFFTDMKFQLPLDSYENYNMVVHGWYDMIYEKKSWVGLNTGSFLIRNCQWSLDLLDAWAPYGPVGKPREAAGQLFAKYLDGRRKFESDDQSALIYLLLSQKDKWSEKTYLEHSYFLHGYWVILVENFEKMMEKYHPGLGDERWPFVTHFVGCKPCHGSSGDYAADRCAKQMERAFNFADNQVLEAYGYVHPSLETESVEKVQVEREAIDTRHTNLRVEAGFDVRIPSVKELGQFMTRLIVEEWAPEGRNMSFYFKVKTETVTGEISSTIADDTNPWWSLMRKAVSKFNATLSPQRANGASDSRFVRMRGVSALEIIPIQNVPFLIHSHNEVMNGYEFLKGIAVITEIVKEYGSYSGSRVKHTSSVNYNVGILPSRLIIKLGWITVQTA
ncbi:hypothetical protein R1sor_023767 [Riccia sorocarpa]|uniref:Xyloglucan 6-xylosyltransferase n=1 Tax=Riccia sorocarpa TaxID=122646 RepID=A0ABD3GQ34_9MARC